MGGRSIADGSPDRRVTGAAATAEAPVGTVPEAPAGEFPCRRLVTGPEPSGSVSRCQCAAFGVAASPWATGLAFTRKAAEHPARTIAPTAYQMAWV